MLIGNKKYSKTLLFWIEKSRNFFQAIKEALAKVINLVHPVQDAIISFTTDVSDSEIDGVLHQIINREKQPLRFFYRNLTPIERKFSAYDQEMFSICTAIKQFKHALKERSFTIFTDEKPLAITFNQNLNKTSTR